MEQMLPQPKTPGSMMKNAASCKSSARRMAQTRGPKARKLLEDFLEKADKLEKDEQEFSGAGEAFLPPCLTAAEIGLCPILARGVDNAAPSLTALTTSYDANSYSFRSRGDR